MNDSDLIAAFLASRGVTKCDAGARTMTNADIKRAVGYEPDSLYRFDVLLTGEDGMEWCERISATSTADARRRANATWPESRVESVTRV